MKTEKVGAWSPCGVLSFFVADGNSHQEGVAMKPTKFLMVLAAIAMVIMASVSMTTTVVADDGQNLISGSPAGTEMWDSALSGSYWATAVVDVYFSPTITGNGPAPPLQTLALVEVNSAKNLSSTGFVTAPQPVALAGATTENPAPIPTLRC